MIGLHGSRDVRRVRLTYSCVSAAHFSGNLMTYDPCVYYTTNQRYFVSMHYLLLVVKLSGFCNN